MLGYVQEAVGGGVGGVDHQVRPLVIIMHICTLLSTCIMSYPFSVYTVFCSAPLLARHLHQLALLRPSKTFNTFLDLMANVVATRERHMN